MPSPRKLAGKMNVSMRSNYVDALELCRLGCKAINIEKFDSARQYFLLAAEMGSIEAAVSLELMYNQGFFATLNFDNFDPRPAQVDLEVTHPLMVHEELKFLPAIKKSTYVH